MPSAGDVIAGKYRLDRLVGSGGMGVVYAGTHLALNQRVAVKFVRADPVDKRTATVRLLREARAVALLTSEHLARVQDVGELDDGSAYLVMELLEGTTLQQIVRQEGKLPLVEACDAAIQVCHALGDAHAHGIVHRDIKPSNLFVVRDRAGLPRVKVIDFGVSKANHGLDDAGMLETKTGSLLGSPPFMSPEQIRAAREVDARTDFWSLGIVIYFLLTGRLPFEAHSLLDLMTRIAYEEPPRLRDVCPGLPDAFEPVLARCLAKRREDRYSSAAQLAEALVPFASERARWIAASVAKEVPLEPAFDVVVDVSDKSLEETSAPIGSPDVVETRSQTSSPLPEAGTVDGLASTDSPTPTRARRSRWGVALGVAAAGALVSASAIFGVTRMSSTRAVAVDAPAGSAPVLQTAERDAHPFEPTEPAPPDTPSAHTPPVLTASAAPIPPAPATSSGPRVKMPRAVPPRPHVPPRKPADILPTTPD